MLLSFISVVVCFDRWVGPDAVYDHRECVQSAESFYGLFHLMFSHIAFSSSFSPKKTTTDHRYYKGERGKNELFFFPSSISRKIFPLLLESTTHVESFRDQHTHSHHFKKENYYSFTRSSITKGLF